MSLSERADEWVAQLMALPDDRRQKIVVESMPFGNILEADTRKVHIVKPADVSLDVWADLAYDICRRCKPRRAAQISNHAASNVE